MATKTMKMTVVELLAVSVPHKKYLPIDRNIVVELVQDPLPVDASNILLPDTTPKNSIGKWTAPIFRAIACGPLVQFVREGDLLLTPISVVKAAISTVFDGDELATINETNVIGVIIVDGVEERFKQLAEDMARRTGTVKLSTGL